LTDSKYGKYIIRNPFIGGPGGAISEGIKGVTFPRELFTNTGLVKGSTTLVDIGWHFSVPDPDPIEQTHSHDFDTVSCFIGSDPKNPSCLGAELEMKLGDEKHMLTQTCVIFIPKGLTHCPLIHISVTRPYLQIVFAISDKEEYIASQFRNAVLPGTRKL